MKIIVTENILIDCEHVEADSVIDLDKDTAQKLITNKRAIEATAEAFDAHKKRRAARAAAGKKEQEQQGGKEEA